jgi:hypothetical protein
MGKTNWDHDGLPGAGDDVTIGALFAGVSSGSRYL